MELFSALSAASKAPYVGNYTPESQIEMYQRGFEFKKKKLSLASKGVDEVMSGEFGSKVKEAGVLFLGNVAVASFYVELDKTEDLSDVTSKLISDSKIFDLSFSKGDSPISRKHNVILRVK